MFTEEQKLQSIFEETRKALGITYEKIDLDIYKSRPCTYIYRQKYEWSFCPIIGCPYAHSLSEIRNYKGDFKTLVNLLPGKLEECGPQDIFVISRNGKESPRLSLTEMSEKETDRLRNLNRPVFKVRKELYYKTAYEAIDKGLTDFEIHIIE